MASYECLKPGEIITLKPCPFCGEEDDIRLTRFEDPRFRKMITYEVKCFSCGARASDWFFDKAGAIRAWNKRGGACEDSDDQ